MYGKERQGRHLMSLDSVFLYIRSQVPSEVKCDEIDVFCGGIAENRLFSLEKSPLHSIFKMIIS